MLLINKYKKNSKISKVSKSWVERNKDTLAYCYKCKTVYNKTITKCVNNCFIESVNGLKLRIRLSYSSDIIRHIEQYLYRQKLIEEGKRGFKLNYYNNTIRRSKVCNKNVNNVKEKLTTTIESGSRKKLSVTSATPVFVNSTKEVSSALTNLQVTTQR